MLHLQPPLISDPPQGKASARYRPGVTAVDLGVVLWAEASLTQPLAAEDMHRGALKG